MYLVTEFVEGGDAAKLADARGGQLSCSETVSIVSQALDALSFAHSLGFIHRDIKAQNILVSGAGRELTAKLADFGLAKSFKQSGMSGVTMAGESVGTIATCLPSRSETSATSGRSQIFTPWV